VQRRKATPHDPWTKEAQAWLDVLREGSAHIPLRSEGVQA
jgi:hypothetical protein